MDVDCLSRVSFRTKIEYNNFLESVMYLLPIRFKHVTIKLLWMVLK